MRIWKIFVLCACVVSLSACASPAQRRQAWAQQCGSYGFQHDTPEMANCIMIQEQQARADARYDMQHASRTLSKTANSYRPVTTNCSVNPGNNVFCAGR